MSAKGCIFVFLTLFTASFLAHPAETFAAGGTVKLNIPKDSNAAISLVGPDGKRVSVPAGATEVKVLEGFRVVIESSDPDVTIEISGDFPLDVLGGQPTLHVLAGSPQITVSPNAAGLNFFVAVGNPTIFTPTGTFSLSPGEQGGLSFDPTSNQFQITFGTPGVFADSPALPGAPVAAAGVPTTATAYAETLPLSPEELKLLEFLGKATGTKTLPTTEMTAPTASPFPIESTPVATTTATTPALTATPTTGSDLETLVSQTDALSTSSRKSQSKLEHL